MTVVVVRYKTEPDRAEENQALVEQVFAELNAKGPGAYQFFPGDANRRAA